MSDTETDTEDCPDCGAEIVEIFNEKECCAICHFKCCNECSIAVEFSGGVRTLCDDCGSAFYND